MLNAPPPPTAAPRSVGLSASLAGRPSLDLLKQRNIIYDAQRNFQRQSELSASLAHRPSTDDLVQRHILHTADEKQKQVEKRQRLEGFLAERPTPEGNQILQAALAPPQGAPPTPMPMQPPPPVQ